MLPLSTFYLVGSLSTLLLSACRAEWAAQIDRRDAIREAFLYNYAKYEEHAYPHDLLMPMSKSGKNNEVLAGFGGTVIDAMSTMLVMHLQDSEYYSRAREHVRNLTFNHTKGIDSKQTVSIFELTIRYLGGLLSAYELGGKQKVDFFLVDKAKELADRLAWGWKDGNRIPYNEININDEHAGDSPRLVSCIAGAGTLTLEWRTLADLTGNWTYRHLAEGAVDAIIDSEPVFPGLYPARIYASGVRKGDYITWGGLSDSFMEYLIKYPTLTGDSDHYYTTVYSQAVESSIKHLLKRTGVGNLTFLADYSKHQGNGTIYIHSHLACFSGGNIAMAGRLLRRDDWVEIGLQLAESCAMTYQRSATGVGPVAFGWFDSDGNAEGWGHVSPLRRRFYNKNGFFISSEGWYLMPEVIESIFYAWRITGQDFWRDLAWDAFLSIQAACDSGEGWVSLSNVNDFSSAAIDETQSFLFAELFKYFYLLFDDPEILSLDDYVFNTEAHPLRRKNRGNFAKIQGTNHSYTRIASSMDHHVPVFAKYDSLHSLAYKASSEERLQAAHFVLPSRTTLLPLTCHTKNGETFGHSFLCKFHLFLLVPSVILVLYCFCNALLRMMRIGERRLYGSDLPSPTPKAVRDYSAEANS